MNDSIGFIGLGIMGRPMAENLVRAGRSLCVWNRTRATAEGLASAHPDRVTVAASAGEVVSKCKVVYSMLSTLEASCDVFGDVVAAAGPGSIIVDCATLTPERMQEMQAAIEAKGAQFLEAPVSGSRKPANNGNLIFLAAGASSSFLAVKEDLAVMGKATHYLGGTVGAGTKMKLCVNMTMGAQLVALGEGLALCEAAGLPSSSLVDILGQGAMASVLVDKKGRACVERCYDTNFPLVHAQKDMRFAVELGDKLGLALPVAASTNETFKHARSLGHGLKDFAAVFEAIRLPGVEAPPAVAVPMEATPVPDHVPEMTSKEDLAVAVAGLDSRLGGDAPTGRLSFGNRKNESCLGSGFSASAPSRSSTRRMAPPGGASSIIF